MEIERVRGALARNPRFRARVFTAEELALCGDRPWRLAGRFAAKEALLKAVGTGLRGFSWHQIEILADALGAPRVVCRGAFAQVLQERGVARIHVSISHGRDYALAQALLERGSDACGS